VNLQQAGQALRARTVSSVELMRHSLQRITQVDSKLKAFITVMAESAEAQAREADARFAAGTDLGPLQGIPVAVKDVFCTAGVRTTCGSKLFADYVPEQDSAVVEESGLAPSSYPWRRLISATEPTTSFSSTDLSRSARRFKYRQALPILCLPSLDSKDLCSSPSTIR